MEGQVNGWPTVVRGVRADVLSANVPLQMMSSRAPGKKDTDHLILAQSTNDSIATTTHIIIIIIIVMHLAV